MREVGFVYRDDYHAAVTGDHRPSSDGDYDHDAAFVPVIDSYADQQISVSNGGVIVAGGVTIASHDQLAAAAAATGKRRFWRQRKYWYWCIGLTLVFLAVFIPLFIFVIFPALAQTLMNKATMTFREADILNPTETSALMKYAVELSGAGPFAAHIEFVDEVELSWDGSVLGTVRMPNADVPAGGGIIRNSATLNIKDGSKFAEFAPRMLQDKQFAWTLKTRINAKVLGLTAKNLKLDKVVNMLGMDGLKNARVLKFAAPADAPDGNGAQVELSVAAGNPSPIAAQLGTVVLDLFYKDVRVGQVTARDAVLGRGDSTLELKGTIFKQTDETGLRALSELFSNYAANRPSLTSARGVSVLPDGKTAVSWLSKGLMATTLQVALKPPAPMNLIRGISIDDMTMVFDPSKPYAPVASAKSIRAKYDMPFGFSLSFDKVATTMSILSNNVSAGTIVTPYTSAKTDVSSSSVQLHVDNATMSIPDETAQTAFRSFVNDLMFKDKVDFAVSGDASAEVITPMGKVTLSGIPFRASSQLQGLSGLSTVQPQINSVSIVGGNENEGIIAEVSLALTNPSPFSLQTNTDVSFDMIYTDSVIGSAVIPKMALSAGSNNITTRAILNPNGSPAGKNLLSKYMAGFPKIAVAIRGNKDSISALPPLQDAVSKLEVHANMPGMSEQLVQSAGVEVLWDTEQTKMALASVNMYNPFNVDLQIASVDGSIVVDGTQLGTASSSDSPNWSTLTAKGKQVTTASLPARLNLDVDKLVKLMYNTAVKAGVDSNQLSLLVKLLQLGDINVPGITDTGSGHSMVKRTSEFDSFDMNAFLKQALRALFGDLSVTADVIIGTYKTKLEFVQTSVPLKTGESMTRLVPIIARPLVSKLLSKAVMGLDSALIHSPTDSGAQAKMKGSVTEAGPISGKFSFVSPLGVYWNNNHIANVDMPSISYEGNVGAFFDVETNLTINDQSSFSKFAETMLTGSSFTWTLKSSNISVNAMGINLNGVGIEKSLVISGMNSFSNLVKLINYTMPGDAKDGGIAVELTTSITNPSQIGIQAGDVILDVLDGESGVVVGEVTANGMTIGPKSTSELALKGRLIPQTEQRNIDAVSAIMSRYISGKNSPMKARARSVSVNGKSIEWMSSALSKLSLGLDLPGPQDLRILQGLDLGSAKLKFSKSTAYAPYISSKDVQARYKMPFSFSFGVEQLQQDLDVYDGNPLVKFAGLSSPWIPAHNDADKIYAAFDNLQLGVASGKERMFESFISDIALGESKSVTFRGVANAIAKTPIAVLPIKGIKFDVETKFIGLQGLKAAPVNVLELDVIGGTTQYILISLKVSLLNPSNIAMEIEGDVKFGLSYDNTRIGHTIINNMALQPGNNTVTASAYFQPDSSASRSKGIEFMRQFVNGNDVVGTLFGLSDTTEIASLNPALSKISVSSTIPGLKVQLAKSAMLKVRDSTLKDNIAFADFTIHNPFSAKLSILTVKADVIYKDVKMGSIDQNLRGNPIVANGRSDGVGKDLPLTMNLNPYDLIKVIKTAAKEANIDLGILGSLIDMYPPQAALISRSHSTSDTTHSEHVEDQRSEITDLIMKIMGSVRVDSTLYANIRVGDYEIPLTYDAKGIALATDDSILLLVKMLGGPIVQKVMDDASFVVDNANMISFGETTAKVHIRAKLHNPAPLDADIAIDEPVQIIWNSRAIGEFMLQPISVKGNQDAIIDQTVDVKILDKNAFSDFAVVMIKAPEFEWTLKSNGVRASALGFEFTGVKLNKRVSFKGFNGLSDIKITGFDIPGDHAGGGVDVSISATLASPSNIGINLGTPTFRLFLGQNSNGNTDSLLFLGTASGSNVELKPGADNPMKMSGVLVAHSAQGELDQLSTMLTDFLDGKDTAVTIVGDTVIPPGASSPPSWLTKAFRSLAIPLTLPGYGKIPGQKPPEPILRSVQMMDLNVGLDEANPWGGVVASNDVQVSYKLPFTITADIQQASVDIVLASNGVPSVPLKVPMSPARNSPGSISVGFKNVPLDLASQYRSPAQQFFKDLFMNDVKNFEVRGSALAITRTNLGVLKLGMPVNVDSSIKGLQGFNAKPVVIRSVDVVGGNRQYITLKLEAGIFNPSPITLAAKGTIALGAGNGGGADLGRIIFNEFKLVPGDNVVTPEFRYMPVNPADGVKFVNDYIAGKTQGVRMFGISDATKIGSLQAALQAVAVQTSLDGLKQKLLTGAEATVHLLSSDTFKLQAEAKVFGKNPFNTDFFITGVQEATITYRGSLLGTAVPGRLAEVAHAGPKGDITASVKAQIHLGDGIMKFLLGLIGGGGQVDLDVNMTVDAVFGSSVSGGYQISPTFAQTSIPSRLIVKLF
ncbi:hypothetical protein GQ42DRAFT_118751 [Ramicandelaber brevisporus]|nr:hypothetical protein GQ42DRAFT_118751 [Ramicandelaber brevisporus]